ncbi:hypothetical protein NW752_008569 [Fusarium irregulare]|uniref:Uncharacterized protein n=1 Tax=Fusarium irregulare TaxID=2494466 RepID=A0A9W8PWM1_9HYPO|nr:hypothetical protein NW752_008569 [Fusarium irregulare]KAJ4020502.1 hypothetical protein NW766_001989 [Fusarium irregulare]
MCILLQTYVVLEKPAKAFNCLRAVFTPLPEGGFSRKAMAETSLSARLQMSTILAERDRNNVAPAKPDQGALNYQDNQTQTQIQTQTSSTRYKASASLESSERIPVQRIIENRYEYHFVKPSDHTIGTCEENGHGYLGVRQNYNKPCEYCR